MLRSHTQWSGYIKIPVAVSILRIFLLTAASHVLQQAVHYFFLTYTSVAINDLVIALFSSIYSFM